MISNSLFTGLKASKVAAFQRYLRNSFVMQPSGYTDAQFEGVFYNTLREESLISVSFFLMYFITRFKPSFLTTSLTVYKRMIQTVVIRVQRIFKCLNAI